MSGFCHSASGSWPSWLGAELSSLFIDTANTVSFWLFEAQQYPTVCKHLMSTHSSARGGRGGGWGLLGLKALLGGDRPQGHVGQGGQPGGADQELICPTCRLYPTSHTGPGLRTPGCNRGTHPRKERAGPSLAATAEPSLSRPPPSRSRRVPARRSGALRPPRRLRRKSPAEDAGRMRRRLRSPGVDPRSGVWAPPRALFINTPRGHPRGATRKVVGSEVRGQQGRQGQTDPLAFAGCWRRGAAWPARPSDRGPGLPGAPRGAHVVRSRRGPSLPPTAPAARSSPWWRPRAPHRSSRLRTKRHDAPSGLRSTGRGSVASLRQPRVLPPARGLSEGKLGAARPRSHARRRGGPKTPRRAGAGPAASTWPRWRSARPPPLPAQPEFALVRGGPAGALRVPRARFMRGGRANERRRAWPLLSPGWAREEPPGCAVVRAVASPPAFDFMPCCFKKDLRRLAEV